MSLPYEIKLSPGKGEGVFATKDLAAGALILQDTKIMETKTGSDIVEAFNRLSLTEQEVFMQLHEGERKYLPKIECIYYVCAQDSPPLPPSLTSFDRPTVSRISTAS